MISADILALELGCTLSDLEDLDRNLGTLQPEHLFDDLAADRLREAWSKRAGIDYTDNELIRATTLEHRVKSVHAVHGTGVTVLDCECGQQFRTAADPEAATRRLWKSHAIHVSTHLMTIGDDK